MVCYKRKPKWIFLMDANLPGERCQGRQAMGCGLVCSDALVVTIVSHTMASEQGYWTDCLKNLRTVV
jgi:hypothetical protein